LLIEEYLEGTEISLMVITDGKTIFLLPPSEDHKQVFDGDKGPNTGGMGAYSPANIPIDEYRALIPLVVNPVLDELARMGITYTGVLYAGLMLTKNGVKVLEYNCRFGDPETQVILPRLNGDLFDIFLKSAEGRLDKADTGFLDNSSVCVVMTSGGYPDEFKKNLSIDGIDDANRIPGVKVLHSGTILDNGVLKTAGGRVLSVVSTALTLPSAISAAYAAVSKISFENAHFRTDIATRMKHG
jgi:phosphoribosylamine--glycine ligase